MVTLMIALTVVAIPVFCAVALSGRISEAERDDEPEPDPLPAPIVLVPKKRKK